MIEKTKGGVMNTKNTKTLLNLTSGKDVVEDWIDRLILWKETLNEEGIDEDLQYEALVLWAGFRRFKPELIDVDIKWFEKLIKAWGKEFATKIRKEDFIDVDQFIKAGEKIKESYFDGSLDDEEREIMTRIMLQDIDDAHLAAMTVLMLIDDDEPLSRLNKPLQWVIQNPDAFLSAEEYIRAMCESFRDDLTDFDPLLDDTAHKFLMILHEVEEMHCRTSRVPSLGIDSKAAQILIKNALRKR